MKNDETRRSNVEGLVAADLETSADLFGEKAVLKPPHSKRFAKFDGFNVSRLRLECGGFSTALEFLIQ